MAVLSDTWFLGIGALFLIVLGAAYSFSTRRFRRWEKMGVPFLKPLPFIGNLKNVLLGKKNLGDLLTEAYETGKGKPFMGILVFNKPMLLIRDLDIMKKVLVKDFNSFFDRTFTSDKDRDPLMSRVMFAVKGQRWRHIRVKLSPTFTTGKMKKLFEFVDECAKDLVVYTKKYSSDGRLEVKETMVRFTTDVVASIGFGIQGNALRDDNSEFRKVMSKIFDFTIAKGIKGAFIFCAPVLMSIFKLKFVDDDVTDYFRNAVWSTVEYRKKNGVVRKDFLDLMIQLKEKGRIEEDSSTEQSDKKFELEGDDFVGLCFGVVIAGFETSSTTMSFALYELSLQPDIQTKLREEIQEILQRSDGEVTYEGIQEMVYLDKVISETLRKYPVLPFLDRMVTQPYTFPGTNIQLEKGDMVVMSLTGIQNDPEYFPEPQRFDPERFSEENKRSRPNYSYMPFGEGPRICFGMRIGLLQAKVGLVQLLSHFEVSPCADTPVPIQYDSKTFFISPRGNLPLAIRSIK